MRSQLTYNGTSEIEVAELIHKIESQAEELLIKNEEIARLEDEVDKLKKQLPAQKKSSNKKKKGQALDKPHWKNCIICSTRFKYTDPTKKICNQCIKNNLKPKKKSHSRTKGSHLKYPTVYRP